MPYTQKQHNLFCAVAYSKKKVRSKSKIAKKKARKMCHEGVKKK